ncbi:MAG TPA: glycosyltransferase, partial [Gallicola sp.]|nr:glycosyltransferase [Gallicola sp.]
MKKISVIVPVYNVEKYIDRCINSLVNQTYPNLEIILVDDGSLDNSGEICDAYAKRYSNIKVIHKDNGGQSSARNEGLRVATGEYIGFVDSDDWILPDMYEHLYKILNEFNCELSMCQRLNIRNEHEAVRALASAKYNIFEGNKIMETYLTSDMLSVWNKLYKKSLFDDNRFPEGKIHEEIYLLYKVLKRAKRIIISKSQKYCYFLSETSTTRSPLNLKDFNMIQEWEKVIEDVKINYPKLKEKAYIRLYISYFNLINKYVMYGANDANVDRKINSLLDSWIGMLKKNKNLLRRSRYVGFNRSLQIDILCTSYKLFKRFKNLYLYLM